MTLVWWPPRDSHGDDDHAVIDAIEERVKTVGGMANE